nr:hypothetical protein [Pedobacter panaciterrae]
MKNLKAHFQIILIAMAVLFLLNACKKNNAVSPEPKEEPFDIKQYILVEKQKTSNTANAEPMLFIRTFEPQSKSTLYTILGPLTRYLYSYNDGVLKIFRGDNTLDQEFKITNNTITLISNTDVSYSCQLIKIPASNQLDGNTYSGGWMPRGSLISYYASLKFTDTRYAEAALNVPVPDKEYTLIKNVGAYIFNNNTKTLLVLMGEKLEGSKYGTSELAGVFTKQ